jgi:betaine reductase
VITPVLKGASFVLTHTPDLVPYGSKPAREINKNPELRGQIFNHLRTFDEAVQYPPNQVFIGNLTPDDLLRYERPWTNARVEQANRFSPWGEIVPQHEFYGWLKVVDEYNLVILSVDFTNTVREALAAHPLIQPEDLKRLGDGQPLDEIKSKVNQGALPLYMEREQLVGCVLSGHEEDQFLSAHIMLENLSNKASGLVAMRHVLDKFNIKPEEIDYVIACDEEAVGDRYQRGGGNMAKAIAEHAGCINASGADVKSFCCAPGHAVQIASALVQAGLYQNVLLIGGGCVAKLGMKFAGHLANNMPILEDQMGAIGMIIGADDGQSPKIRTDAFGKHAISAGSSAQNIYQALIVKPLESIGKGIMDIDKYAVELHNPDVTEPNGNGNVPRTNYRTIAAMAVIRGEMSREEMNDFEAKHGLPGFSPTQGHIASAIPFIGHARKMIMDGEINNAMFVGKGSLFLGKMTQLSDGVSFILEKNN